MIAARRQTAGPRVRDRSLTAAEHECCARWEIAAWMPLLQRSASSARASPGTAGATAIPATGSAARPATRSSSGSATRSASAATAWTSLAESGGDGATATGLDLERLALEFVVVHLLDGGLGLFLIWHGNETESAGFAGNAVPDDFDGRDLTKSGKCFTKLLFRGACGQIPHVNVHVPVLSVQVQEPIGGIPADTDLWWICRVLSSKDARFYVLADIPQNGGYGKGYLSFFASPADSSAWTLTSACAG